MFALALFFALISASPRIVGVPVGPVIQFRAIGPQNAGISSADQAYK